MKEGVGASGRKAAGGWTAGGLVKAWVGAKRQAAVCWWSKSRCWPHCGALRERHRENSGKLLF